MEKTTSTPRVSSGRKCRASFNGIGENRITWLFFAIGFLFLALSFQLYILQVVRGGEYQLLSDGQHVLEKKLVPDRGSIYFKDKDGLYAVAVNRSAKMAYAVPREMDDRQSTADNVASVLSLDTDAVRDRFINGSEMYEPLKHRLSDDEINALNDRKIPGIHLADETYRYYPAGELGAGVLGFVGWSGNQLKGRYGVEASFDDALRGEEGKIVQNRDTLGRWISIGKRQLQEAKSGQNVVLTIDHIVQYEAEKILQGALKKYEAESGSIVIMDATTGDILAMANAPTFDPNNYGSVSDPSVFNNQVVSQPYEPGSVFKTFTLAAALDSGKITPDTTYVDTGLVKEAGYTIQNSDRKANGLQTMTNVLEKSLNTGVIYAEKLIGNINFADYVKRFGFGETTGMGLFGEQPGNLKNLNDLRSNIQFFTASFGQGIMTTPIQLAAGYGAIANGGMLIRPKIVDKLINFDGSETHNLPEEVRRVISQQAALEITQMLQSVVENGHGKQAGVPGYWVAGKTGTAQVVDPKTGKYSDTMKIGTFAGFAPVESPKFVMVVEMDNPKAVEWAESSAAPTFGEMMKFLLDYYKIEPTRKTTPQQLKVFEATHNLRALMLEEDKKEGETNNVNASEKNN